MSQREKEEFYRKIIQIMDSDDQQQERRVTEEKRAIQMSSQVKHKPEKMTRTHNDQEWSNHTCIQLQNKRTGISFLDVHNYSESEVRKDKSLVTSSFVNFKGSLINFLKNPNKNVLFIFGPSGCGKTFLTLDILIQHNLPYEYLEGNVQINDESGQNEYENDIHLLTRKFRSTKSAGWSTVNISKDFPKDFKEISPEYSKKYKQFKQTIYDMIAGIENKHQYIFILNSEMYSSYYLLSQASENRSIARLKNVSVIKMEPYGVTDMKKIITGFVNKYSQYSSITKNPRDVDEILTEASGDARKALNIIYYRKVRETARLNSFSNNNHNNKKILFYPEPIKQAKQTTKKRQFGVSITKTQTQLPEKQQGKVGLFHTLGKFLYGKRKNIDYQPNKKNGKNNKISRFYTQQELQLYNPKFYFKPVDLFERSHMILNVFVDLLEQNFLNRYGKVHDIKKMYDVFRFYDSYLQETLDKYAIKEHMQENIKELITWGIILYNKNSVQNNTFMSFQRSKNNIHKKILEAKLELIKSHYLRLKNDDSTIKYNINDIILFGYILKCDPYWKPNDDIYLRNLIEIIFDNVHKSNSVLGSSVQKGANVIQENEEQMPFKNCGKLNKISEQLIFQVNHRVEIINMVSSDSNEQDIDSD